MRIILLSLVALLSLSGQAVAQEPSPGAVKFRAGMEEVLQQKYLKLETFDACTDCKPESRSYIDWSGKKTWELTYTNLYAKRPKVYLVQGGKSYKLNRNRCLVRDRSPRRAISWRPQLQDWVTRSWDLSETGPNEIFEWQLGGLPEGQEVSFSFWGDEGMLMSMSFSNQDQQDYGDWQFEELLSSPKKQGDKYRC